MKSSLIVGCAVLLALLSPASAWAEAAPALGSTFVIGDSTSSRLTGEWDRAKHGSPTPDLWQQHHPTWHVDAVGGRPADQLPVRISHYLAHTDSAPARLIMALGSNPTIGWTKADYRAALDLLPDTTRIVVVLPYRDARHGSASQRVGRDARWLRALAVERDDTVFAPWRRTAVANPRLLVDGVHQTSPRGRLAWLRVIESVLR